MHTMPDTERSQSRQADTPGPARLKCVFESRHSAAFQPRGVEPADDRIAQLLERGAADVYVVRPTAAAPVDDRYGDGPA